MNLYMAKDILTPQVETSFSNAVTSYPYIHRKHGRAAPAKSESEVNRKLDTSSKQARSISHEKMRLKEGKETQESIESTASNKVHLARSAATNAANGRL